MNQLTRFELAHAGTTLVGQMARPEGKGPFPAVLVMHSALSLGRQVRELAVRLASLGYVAVATDMFGGGVEISDPWMPGQVSQVVHRNPDLIRSRTLVWYNAAADLPDVVADRIAAIGYCFGGTCVL